LHIDGKVKEAKKQRKNEEQMYDVDMNPLHIVCELYYMFCHAYGYSGETGRYAQKNRENSRRGGK